MTCQSTHAAPRLLRYPRQAAHDLAKDRGHGFAQAHALSIYPSQAIYSFIPKNACSTLRYSIAVENGMLAPDDPVDWIHNNNATFVASLSELARAKYAFVILRCPFRRLASVFLDKVVQADPTRTAALVNVEVMQSEGLSRQLKRIRRRLARMTDTPLNLGQFTFRDFVARMSKGNAIMTDHHWAPQTAHLVYQHYDGVFAVEAMAETAAELKAQIGLEIRDARGLTKHGTDHLQKIDEGCFADHNLDALHQMRARGEVPAHSALFDDALVAQVAQLYADDLALYVDHFGRGQLLFPNAPH